MNDEGDARSPDAVRIAAANWFARRHGPDSDRWADAFNAWIAEDPAHEAAWQRLQRRWDQSKFLQHSDTVRSRNLASVAVWYRRPVARRAAVVLFALGIAGAGSLALLHEQPLQSGGFRQVVASTGVGEVRTFDLSDGSKVTLDGASQLRTEYTPQSRTVRLLAGAARFAVVRDDKRQFAVVTSTGSVTTNGATFDVDQTSGLLRVTSLRGDLRVYDKSVVPGIGSVASRYLSSGQQVSSSPGAGTSAPKPVAPGADGWPSGMLAFDGERLADAVERFNRRNRRKLVIADKDVAELRITGAFHADDPAGFARTVASMFSLKLVSAPDGDLQLGPKKKNVG